MKDQSQIDAVLSQVRRKMERLGSLVDGPRASIELAELGAPAIEALRNFLLTGTPTSLFQPRQWAVETLAAMGAKDVLIEYLAQDRHIADAVVLHGEDAVRSAAARLVTEWKTDEIFQLLMILARKRVLPGVISALGTFHRPEALPVLEYALEDDVARPSAEQALLAYGEAASEILIATVTWKRMDGELEVPSSLLRRRSAAKILADTGIGNARWLELRELLEESDPELAVSAARIASAAAPDSDLPGTVAAILRVLPEAPWWIREDARTCLMALYPAGESLIKDEISRRAAASPLIQASDHTLRLLLRVCARAEELHAIKK